MVPDVIADDAQVSEVFQWEDAVVYFALVDRFSDGDSQHDEVSGAA